MVPIFRSKMTDHDLLLSKKWLSESEIKRFERYFYFKYQQLFRKMAHNQRKKFYSLAIDFEDLLWLAPVSISESIQSYRNYFKNEAGTTKAYPFRVFLINNYRYKTMDYLKKHVAKKHRALNTSKLINAHNHYKFIDNNPSNHTNNIQLLIFRLFYQKYYREIKTLSAKEKHIWKMKLNGYKLAEITSSLQLKYSKIDNTIQKITRLIKQRAQVCSQK